jgi:serine protease Do
VSIRDLNANELRQLDTKGGVLIQDVRRGGIASQARIMPGDVVTQINNKQINDTKDFIAAVTDLKKNSVARVTIIREGQRAIVGMRIE